MCFYYKKINIVLGKSWKEKTENVTTQPLFSGILKLRQVVVSGEALN